MFPAVPPEIKPVAHLMKLAEEHDIRNIVVAYWARMAACSLAMKIVPGQKSSECTILLTELLKWLEKTKEQNRSNDGIINETAAQAIIEEYALNLFNHAESQDAAEIFNKNTVKTFYTAGMLFDVLEQFGLSEDLHEKQKYAKWKAAYIHNCLKNGEKPQPGPPNSGNESNKMVHISELPEEEQFRLLEQKRKIQEEFDRKKKQENDEEELEALNRLSAGGNSGSSANTDEFKFPLKLSPISPEIPQQPAGSVTPITPQPSNTSSAFNNLPKFTNYGISINSSEVTLTPEQIQKAQKFSKYATSALNYDDVKTAIENLQKALNLLQFGKE